MLKRIAGVTLSMSALLVAACGGPDTAGDGQNSEASLVAVEVTGEGEVEKYDLNGDGEPDVTKIFTRVGADPEQGVDGERILARAELDVNFDGKIDLRQFFNESGAMVREEMDLDFDGQVDAVDYYLDGAIFKRELFLNFQEKPSIWKFFEEGKLVRKERDTDGDGKPDTFEYFEGDRLVRVGFDSNADGEPDYYEESGAAEE